MTMDSRHDRVFDMAVQRLMSQHGYMFKACAAIVEVCYCVVESKMRRLAERVRDVIKSYSMSNIT